MCPSYPPFFASHVNGFLKEIGQGIQHVASRVENLVEFVQRCNDMREITGEVRLVFGHNRMHEFTMLTEHIFLQSGRVSLSWRFLGRTTEF